MLRESDNFHNLRFKRMEQMLADFKLLPAAAADLDVVSILESCSFPADEAASAETIIDRYKGAGKFFFVIKKIGVSDCIGFINATCTIGLTVNEESMRDHVPEGKSLVIHSVTISHEYRRCGVGSAMLRSYIDRIAVGCPEITRLLLLSKAHLLGFYISCGFQLVGLSSVNHGEENWFEMRIDLGDYRNVEQYQVDAFSSVPFSGNPAAIVFDQKEETWMQCIAAENNLAETAFVKARLGSGSDFDIRWFSPLKEVELCGHGTLASAHAIYESGRVISRCTPIRFFTNFGEVLTAVGTSEGLIQLNFPATPPVEEALSPQDLAEVIKGFSITSKDILFTGRTVYDLFIEISAAAFRKINLIDFDSLKRLGGRGIILTCQGNALGHNFTSRFFGPSIGINEDSVTGSAHCALAPYWFEQLDLHYLGNKTEKTISGYQASSRGGVVILEMTDHGKRVLISGSSITVLKSKLLI